MDDIFTEKQVLFKETELVYKTYLLCNLQQRAYDTIVKNVLSADLRWVHDRKSSLTVANDPIDRYLPSISSSHDSVREPHFVFSFATSVFSVT